MEDDAQLLKAVSESRPGAFDAFVDRYGRRLLAFGRRMCRTPQDAEDVFQETLLKAYQGLAAVRDPGAVRTWLYRVVSTQCLMKRRKERPEREIPLESYKPEGLDFGEPVEIPDWSHLPEDYARRVELHAALEEALAELPAELRVVVLLRDVEGLSTREAADALDLGVSAVKMRLHRARLALREHLERHYEKAA